MAFETPSERRVDGVHLESHVGEFEKDWILINFDCSFRSFLSLFYRYLLDLCDLSIFYNDYN